MMTKCDRRAWHRGRAALAIPDRAGGGTHTNSCGTSKVSCAPSASATLCSRAADQPPAHKIPLAAPSILLAAAGPLWAHRELPSRSDVHRPARAQAPVRIITTLSPPAVAAHPQLPHHLATSASWLCIARSRRTPPASRALRCMPLATRHWRRQRGALSTRATATGEPVFLQKHNPPQVRSLWPVATE
jgi:hypothetical protein